MDKKKRQIIEKEKERIRRIKELLIGIKNKYNLSLKELQKLILYDIELFPSSIFTNKLTVLESIVKYMKEELGLNYHSIGELLNRNEKNIWHTYNNAKRKYQKRLLIEGELIPISLEILRNRKLSPLAAIIQSLSTIQRLSTKEIAKLLRRNYKTIWTIKNKK